MQRASIEARVVSGTLRNRPTPRNERSFRSKVHNSCISNNFLRPEEAGLEYNTACLPVRSRGADRCRNQAAELGLERKEQAFRDHDVEAHLLLTVSADDLREMGVVSF